MNIPSCLFAIISSHCTIRECVRLYTSHHHLYQIASSIRHHIMERVTLTPSSLLSGFSCQPDYRFHHLELRRSTTLPESTTHFHQMTNQVLTAISGMTSLESLHVDYSMSKTPGLHWFHLTTLRLLHHLTLSYMSMKSKDDIDPMDMVSCLPSLHSLHLPQFYSGSIPSGYIWPSSLRILQISSSVPPCSFLDRVSIGDVSLPQQLMHLEISHTDIYHKSCSCVAIALSHCPHLHTLKLLRCEATDISLLPTPSSLSLTSLHIESIDDIVEWINQLPALSDLGIYQWMDITPNRLHGRYLTSFHHIHGGDTHGSQCYRDLLSRHSQLKQLSWFIINPAACHEADEGIGWPCITSLSSLTSLHLRCHRYCSIQLVSSAPFIGNMTSKSLCELHLCGIPFSTGTWDALCHDIWPNLRMMDVSYMTDTCNASPRSSKWIDSFIAAITRLTHVSSITMIDETSSGDVHLEESVTPLLSTIASLDHIRHMHVHIDNRGVCEAVLSRGGSISTCNIDWDDALKL
jgi:hypothetical protein